MKKHLCMMGIMIFLLIFAAGVVCAQTESEPPAPAPTQPGPPYRDFDVGDRFGTWALNAFVLPGLGSYAVMHDVLGGTIQLIVGGVGWGLGIASIVVIFNAVNDTLTSAADDPLATATSDNPTQTIDDAINTSRGLIIASVAVITVNGIFNIIRSATYHKPKPKVGSLVDPNAWSLAIVPGSNGVEAVQLAYTLRF